jgi:hypothetical protein
MSGFSMQGFRLIACAALVLAACSSNTKKRPLSLQEMIAADPLPLAKGSKWTYAVTVKRFDPDTDKESTKKLSWTTEVIDAKEANGITAYKVRGWLTDLADSDPEPIAAGSGSAAPTIHATEKTLLRSGNHFMFGPSPSTGEPSIDGAEGWFTWPVLDGDRICPSAEMVYCWKVSAVETGYALSFYTGPDEQTFELEPGTGVSRFHYAHHGTTNEIEAKLVSYTKAH